MRLNITRVALADWATVLMAVCAVVVAGMVVKQQLFGASAPTVEDKMVEDWRSYLTGGARIGPEDAPVTIIVFGDYECPFCQRLDQAVRSVRAEYPEEVAAVYLHMPLSYHEHAYQAARFAECAAHKGRFHEAHTLLYDLEGLDGLDPTDFGSAAGVLDLASFVECASDESPVPGIEDDLAVARDLQVTSTPTVIVNGLRLGRTPDANRLSEVVRSALTEARNRPKS